MSALPGETVPARRTKWPAVRAVLRGALQLAAGAGAMAALVGVSSLFTRAPRQPEGWTVIRPPYDVCALALDGPRLWTGGRDGFALIDRATGRVVPSPLRRSGLRDVRDLLVAPDGALWVAHARGVSVARGEAVVAVWPSGAEGRRAARALCRTRAGALWAGTADGAVRFDGKVWEPDPGAAVCLPGGIDAIVEDREGRLWFASMDRESRGLACREAAGEWRLYTTADGLPSPCVNAVFQDASGCVWAATGFGSQGDAARLVGDRWERWARPDGLAGTKVRSLFQDSAGRMWFGAEYEGVAVHDLAAARWTVLTPRGGLSGWEVKETVADDAGVLWLGTENGLTRMLPSSCALTNGVPSA